MFGKDLISLRWPSGLEGLVSQAKWATFKAWKGWRIRPTRADGKTVLKMPPFYLSETVGYFRPAELEDKMLLPVTLW